MMEAASTSETSVNFYQATRRYISEHSHLHARRRKNLKSHPVYKKFVGKSYRKRPLKVLQRKWDKRIKAHLTLEK
jgi:hypothetical protein